MIRAQSADGKIHEFPDGTDPTAIDNAMRQYAASLLPKKRSASDLVTGAAANMNRGLGIGDEMAAGFATAEGLLTGRHRFGTDQPGNVLVNNAKMLRDAYVAELAGQRDKEDTFSAEHPNVAALSRGTGNALTMAAPAGPGAEVFATGGRAVNALRGATVAAATGAAYAAVDRGTPAERLRAASEASHDPMTLALGAAGGAVAAKARPKPEKPPTASVDELRSRKDAAYQAVDDAGIAFRKEAVADLATGITAELNAAHISPTRHPKAVSMLRDIQKMKGRPQTLTQIDQLRQVIYRDVASSNDRAEAFMGKKMIQNIDEFVDAAGPAQLAEGAATNGSVLIRRAREMNMRMRKLESVDAAVAEARGRAGSTGTGGNIDNATRQELRKVARKTPNLTEAEGAAFEKAVIGTRGQNALRQVGRMSPAGGTVSQVGSIITGAASHGVLPTVGFVARNVADAITAKNVGKLRELIASGGEVAAEVQKQLARPEASELRRQLANDLAVQAGVQGASASSTR